jgi:hypothetical protein
MSYARAVVLWCNARDVLPSGQDFGCYAEFELPPGRRFEPLAAVRRAAREAGWAYVRDPGSIRGLDKDYCPRHKPQEG